MMTKDTTLVCVRFGSVTFLLLISVLSTSQLNCSEPTTLQFLNALTPIFDLKDIRPVLNMSTVTVVSVHIVLHGILGVNEKAQLLTTYLCLTYWWKNEFIFWDPGECGIDKLTVPRERFWYPDMVINEFMDQNTAPYIPFVYLYNDGMFFDESPAKVISSCNLNIYTFPFDIQDCTLTFNSYALPMNELKIIQGDTAESITRKSKRAITTMGEWELLDITSHQFHEDLTDGAFFDKLMFKIRLRRRPLIYVVNLLIPSCFLLAVDLFSFMLPPNSVDRSSFKMTLILGYTVFLLIMNDLLPITGNSIPLINVFFSMCLALMVSSLLETIFITSLMNSSDTLRPVPHWVRLVFLQIVGYIICLPSKTEHRKDPDLKLSIVTRHQSADEGTVEPVEEDRTIQELRTLGRILQVIQHQVEQKLVNTESSEEWMQVAFIIDRLLFFLYAIFVTVSFFTLTFVWVNSYYKMAG